MVCTVSTNMEKKSTLRGAFFVLLDESKKRDAPLRMRLALMHNLGLLLGDLQLVFEDLEVFLGLVDLLLVLGTHQL